MRKSLLAFGLSLILFSLAFAQDSQTEKRQLTERVTASYQKGDLEKAIKAGEQLVKLEKAGGDPVSYVNALINLGRIKREYYVSLQNKLTLKKVDVSEINQTREKAEQTADDAELLFRMALELNERFGKGQTPQTADIKRDLAWVVSNHLSSSKRNLGGSRSRIDEGAKLYNESIELSEQTRGKDADETLFIVSMPVTFIINMSVSRKLSLYMKDLFRPTNRNTERAIPS
jgi:tetratricopeptide (TPR) repeat protein